MGYCICLMPWFPKNCRYNWNRLAPASVQTPLTPKYPMLSLTLYLYMYWVLSLVPQKCMHTGTRVIAQWVVHLPWKLLISVRSLTPNMVIKPHQAWSLSRWLQDQYMYIKPIYMFIYIKQKQMSNRIPSSKQSNVFKPYIYSCYQYSFVELVSNFSFSINVFLIFLPYIFWITLIFPPKSAQVLIPCLDTEHEKLSCSALNMIFYRTMV